MDSTSWRRGAWISCGTATTSWWPTSARTRMSCAAPPTARPSGDRSLLLPQVGLPHEVGAQQVGGRILQHDAAGLDDIAAVGDPQGHPRILLHEQDRRALAV